MYKFYTLLYLRFLTVNFFMKGTKMTESNGIEKIKAYMKDGSWDYYYYNLIEECDTLLWIDHRDCDEEIINGVETILKTGHLRGELIEETIDKIDEIIIHYKGEKTKIEYIGEEADRDTTIISLNEVLKPDYEIRLCKNSLGSDTLAFLPLSAKQWIDLENEFGQNKVNKLFIKISKETKMFN